MTALRAPRRGQHGAALLTAMIIVTLVATIAGSMVWQQWRAVQVEAAERARAQSHWLLGGAIDWARLILREDARSSSQVDHLGEPWAVPLAEAKLSTFLAADRENTDDAPDAFLSGGITDAQSRYNLRNLSAGSDPAAEKRVLQRLLDLVGARPELATLLVQAIRDAAPTTDAAAAALAQATTNPGAPGAAGSAPAPFTHSADPPLMPERIDQLRWLGVDAESAKLLAPYVTLLPRSTTVNLNTAPKEVIAAVVEGMDLAAADRLVQARVRAPFQTVADAQNLVAGTLRDNFKGVGVNSSFFEIYGRLRLQDRVVEERALVARQGNQGMDVVPLRRERVAAVDSTAP